MADAEQPRLKQGTRRVKRAMLGLLEALGLRRKHRDREARHRGYDFESEAREMIQLVRDHTMTTLPRLITLYQQVRYCETMGIAGAFVECGVWKGGAIGLMALANLRHGATRRELHLFDAFSEICEPDATVDGLRAVREVRALALNGGGVQGRLEPLTGIYDSIGGPGTLDENRLLLEETIGYSPGQIRYHQGWFQDTVPRDAPGIGPIAILRLDGDWYASTKVCLDHLYDKVVSGGVVIIDDYATYDGCRKAVDEFIVNRGLKVFLSHVDSDCRYWIKL